MKNDDIVQSVERAISILEALSHGEIGLVELSKKVDLNKSTVHRLLNTLMYKGYVSQNMDNSRYKLTLKVAELSTKVLGTFDIVAIAKPYLKELVNKTNEVVHLVHIEKDDIVYIDKVEPDNIIRMHSYIGKRIPIYSTAVGKAYMAFLEEHDFDKYWEEISKKIVKLTENTINTKEGMVLNLKTVREVGYATDMEENEKDVICVAAPIFSFDKSIKYAISISTPKIRIDDERIKLFGRLVKETTANISKELGC